MTPQIVLFLPSFESGGVERNAVYVANALASHFDVHVLYCRKLPKWFDRLDARVRRAPVERRLGFVGMHERIVDAANMLVFGRRVIRDVRRRGPTALLSFQSNAVAIVLARACGVPVAVRLSNAPSAAKHEPTPMRRLAETAKVLTYRFANACIANSADLAAAYRKRLGTEIEVIYNPIDTSSVQRLMSAEVTEDLLRHKRRPVIVSAGRLSAQKNFGLALRALREVLSQEPCDLMILGEGEERGQLEQLARDLGVAEHVHLLGDRDNVYKYFARSDIFLLSSNYEGFPNALLEAVACGLPAVATDCATGPAEVLCGGEGGELVPVGDSGALASALLRMLRDPTAARAKADVAQKSLARYKLETIAAQYVGVASRLVSQSR